MNFWLEVEWFFLFEKSQDHYKIYYGSDKILHTCNTTYEIAHWYNYSFNRNISSVRADCFHSSAIKIVVQDGKRTIEAIVAYTGVIFNTGL